MKRWAPGQLAAGLCTLVMGCAETRPEPEQTLAGPVQVLFDPSASPPELPMPSDLALDPVTGLLVVPTVPDADPAVAYLNAYLNQSTGFPPSALAEVRFSGKLARETINSDSIRVVDLTDGRGPTPVNDLLYDYRLEEPRPGTTRALVRVAAPDGWRAGHTYAVYVVGGSHGVKDEQGNTVRRSMLFSSPARAVPSAPTTRLRIGTLLSRGAIRRPARAFGLTAAACSTTRP